MQLYTQRILLTLALACMWSPSFLFIKLAIAEIPIYTIVALRVSLAAFLLGLIMLGKRLSFPTEGRFWFHSLIFAILSSVFPFCMFCFAEQTIDSALAAILNGTTPMFTALLAHFFLGNDRLDSQKGWGIGLSVAGLLFLFWPALEFDFSDSGIGMGAAILGAFSYALSHVYAKKYLAGHRPFVAPTAQLALSALVLIPLALFIDDFFALPLPSLSAISGVVGLSFFGTFLAFILYYRLLEISGPTAISLIACFFPVGGMLLGFIFLGETLTWEGMLAASSILLGLALVNGIIQLPKRAPASEPVS